MYGCMRAKNRIQALQNTPETFDLRQCRSFVLISILIVSLVPGSDVAGAEPLQVSSVTVVSAPSNGAVTINPVEGSIQYTPETGFVGSETFTYKVCNWSSPTLLCNTDSVIIMVQTLARAWIQVTIDFDILGNAIAATVQTRTAAASNAVNVQLDVANSTGLSAVLSGPKHCQAVLHRAGRDRATSFT